MLEDILHDRKLVIDIDFQINDVLFLFMAACHPDLYSDELGKLFLLHLSLWVEINALFHEPALVLKLVRVKWHKLNVLFKINCINYWLEIIKLLLIFVQIIFGRVNVQRHNLIFDVFDLHILQFFGCLFFQIISNFSSRNQTIFHGALPHTCTKLVHLRQFLAMVKQLQNLSLLFLFWSQLNRFILFGLEDFAFYLTLFILSI